MALWGCYTVFLRMRRDDLDTPELLTATSAMRSKPLSACRTVSPASSAVAATNAQAGDLGKDTLGAADHLPIGHVVWTRSRAVAWFLD